MTRMQLNKNFTILTYLLGSLIVISIFAQGLSVAIDRTENSKPSPVETIEVYRDLSGSPKYALGECSTDFDCSFSGCSEEFCSSEEVVSACIVIEDHPKDENYECSCVENACVWAR